MSILLERHLQLCKKIVTAQGTISTLASMLWRGRGSTPTAKTLRDVAEGLRAQSVVLDKIAEELE